MNVGWRSLAAMDEVQGARVPVHLLYPTEAEARTERIGPYEIELARDAPIAGTRLPLVLVSHGSGSMPWLHRRLAAHLARAGFGVALLEHPGNSRSDDSLANTPANLANRPRHVRRALDLVLDGGNFEPVGIIGHSLGGYTALASVGGRPVTLPDMTPDGRAHPIDVEPDARLRAAVLLAPALPWFLPDGSLDDVRVPLFVRTGEKDELSPPYFVEHVLRGRRMDYEVVRNAGHFSFVTPFPRHMAVPGFLPAQDPPGFDREAYLRSMCSEVVAFLQAQLSEVSRS